jgi:hypothetical protein
MVYHNSCKNYQPANRTVREKTVKITPCGMVKNEKRE